MTQPHLIDVLDLAIRWMDALINGDFPHLVQDMAKADKATFQAALAHQDGEVVGWPANRQDLNAANLREDIAQERAFDAELLVRNCNLHLSLLSAALLGQQDRIKQLENLVTECEIALSSGAAMGKGEMIKRIKLIMDGPNPPKQEDAQNV